MEQPAEDSPEIRPATARGSARASLITGGLGVGVSALPPLLTVAGAIADVSWPASNYLVSAFSGLVCLQTVLGFVAAVSGVAGLALERQAGTHEWRAECVVGLALGLLALCAGCFLESMIWYWITGDYKPY